MHIIFSFKNLIFSSYFVFKSYFASIISEKGRIRIRIRILEAKKHADSADPDPQHCATGSCYLGKSDGPVLPLEEIH